MTQGRVESYCGSHSSKARCSLPLIPGPTQGIGATATSHRVGRRTRMWVIRTVHRPPDSTGPPLLPPSLPPSSRSRVASAAPAAPSVSTTCRAPAWTARRQISKSASQCVLSSVDSVTAPCKTGYSAKCCCEIPPPQCGAPAAKRVMCRAIADVLVAGQLRTAPVGRESPERSPAGGPPGVARAAAASPVPRRLPPPPAAAGTAVLNRTLAAAAGADAAAAAATAAAVAGCW